MRALLLLILFISFALAQREVPQEEVIPEAQESDALQEENDELRAQLDEVQNDCNCNQEREENPIVIINEMPAPQQEVQKEEAIAPPQPLPQFNNDQYQNNLQFVFPAPDNPPPGVNLTVPKY